MLAVSSAVDPSGLLRVVSDAADAIAIQCVADTIQINGADPDSGPAPCTTITAIEVLGGAGANVIDLSGLDPSRFPALSRIQVDGGGGGDRLIGPGLAKSWFVTATDEGSLGGADLEPVFTTFNFTSIENLLGGPAADAFFFTDGASLSGVLDGGGGGDTLDFGDLTSPVAVGLTGSDASGFQGTATDVGGGFSGIVVLVGGASADTLTGRDGESSWTLAEAQAYNDGNNVLTFAGFETLRGGAGGDTFDLFGDAAGGLMAQLLGGPGDDLFLFHGFALLTGSIAGEAGLDTLSYSDFGSSISVVLTGSDGDGYSGDEGSTFAGGAFSGIDELVGSGLGNGPDFLTGEDVDATWTLGSTTTYDDGRSPGALSALGSGANLAGSDSGSILGGDGSLSFSAFEVLQGGTAADLFDIRVDTTVIVKGGAGDDRFTFSVGGARLDGRIDGEGGGDTLSYADDATGVAVTLTGSGATGYRGIDFNGGTAVTSGGFDGIEALIGGTGGDTLTGEDAMSVWSLGTTPTYNDGSAGLLRFSAFETLQGGAAADRFNLALNTTADLRGGAGDDVFVFAADGVALTGSIAGQEGSDTIDYAGFTAAVDINLAAGTATGVGGGIGGIEHASGGSGDDALIGDGQDNILCGQAGNDLLIDGDGDDRLFGGEGNDTYALTLGGAGADLISDPGGDDTLDVSNARSGVTINLDSPAVQVVSPGIAVQLIGQIENFIGSDLDDTIAAGALLVPRRIDGRGPVESPGDTLFFDDRGQSFTITPTTILANGFAPVTYISIETLPIQDPDVPATPTAPDLQEASDSGLSNTDDITNVTGPAFDIGNIQDGQIVFLLRDGLAVGSAIGLSGQGGRVTIVDIGPVSGGLHRYEARQGADASNLSPLSPALMVTIDIGAPAPITDLALAPGSDTGVRGDDRTSVRRPVLVGTAEPDTVVEVIDAAGNVLGRAPSGTGGAFSVPLDADLLNGPIALRARARDAAGNVGQPGTPLILTIVATDGDDIDPDVPATPTAPDLQEASDSGLSNTDDITNVTGPAFDIGNIQDGQIVFLLRDGVAVGSAIGPPGPGGRVTIVDIGPVPGGVHRYEARQGDDASNLSPLSPALFVTIDIGVPAPIPDLALAPGSDTGVRGDDRTSVRRPVLVGTAEPDTVVEVIDAAGNVLGRAPNGTGGAFSVPLDGDLLVGPIMLRARARDASGNVGQPGAPLSLTIVATDGDPIVTTDGDYDGDGRADLAIFRRITAVPRAGRWLIARRGLGLQSQFFGGRTDIPLRGDFDGDGIADLAVFRRASAVWFVRGSRGLSRAVQFGPPGRGLPVPADYDGDGLTDFAVYRPGASRGAPSVWWILGSRDGVAWRMLFGGRGQVPVPADYDGDGRADLATYRQGPSRRAPSVWSILGSRAGDVRRTPFGSRGQVPVPADYDGDGRADLATFRPGHSRRAPSVWFVLGSRAGDVRRTPFGGAGRVPVPADYDGDGRADLATFRPASARWLIRSSATDLETATRFVARRDVPIPAPLPYRLNRATGPS